MQRKYDTKQCTWVILYTFVHVGIELGGAKHYIWCVCGGTGGQRIRCKTLHYWVQCFAKHCTCVQSIILGGAMLCKSGVSAIGGDGAHAGRRDRSWRGGEEIQFEILIWKIYKEEKRKERKSNLKFDKFIKRKKRWQLKDRRQKLIHPKSDLVSSTSRSSSTCTQDYHQGFSPHDCCERHQHTLVTFWNESFKRKVFLR